MRLIGSCVGSLDSSGPQECGDTLFHGSWPIRVVWFKKNLEKRFLHIIFTYFAHFTHFMRPMGPPRPRISFSILELSIHRIKSGIGSDKSKTLKISLGYSPGKIGRNLSLSDLTLCGLVGLVCVPGVQKYHKSGSWPHTNGLIWKKLRAYYYLLFLPNSYPFYG